MKLFCFGDVHGDEIAMLEGLKRAGYDNNNSNHQIISLGDNFGRASTGRGSRGVYNYLTSDKHANPPICIRGNHETILLDIFKRGFLTQTDIYNGEIPTICSFANCNKAQALLDKENIDKTAAQIEEWIINMPWYYETSNYIFTHGWLPHNQNQWDKLTTVSTEDWHEASWSDTLSEVTNFISKFPNGWKKHIVVGHWTAAEFISLFERKYNRYGEIYTADKYKITFCDCTTAYSHHIEIFTVED